jgi:hypothetical protein
MLLLISWSNISIKMDKWCLTDDYHGEDGSARYSKVCFLK